MNSWLANAEAPSNILITAPAGRGKTALLVRWLNQLNIEVWPVVFVPISIRYETNRAAIFYQALAARLADVLGEALPPTLADPASFYRDKVIEYLDLFHGSDRRCLLVIDGLDEAAGWQVDTSVLPLDPAPGLRIVVSARQLAGDRGSTGWLRRLGWKERGVLAQTLEVSLLDRAGIADVIKKIISPLGSLAGQVDVIAELTRLTAGEPLLIELYIKALLEQGDQALRLRPKDLHRLNPGFADFFRTWWELQRRAWRDEQTVVDEQTIQAILAILACALGPIRLVELARLLQKVYDTRQFISADSLHPIRRFVIGDGVDVGYSFSHPKLGEHFRDEHFGGGEVIQKTRAAFAEWGRQTVRALNEGRLAPSTKPEYGYLLEHYSLHLQQEGAKPEIWMELVEDGWRRSWEAFEGDYRGFARDVQAAWDAVKIAQTTEPPPPLPLSLAAEIRCALCLNSLRNFGSNIPSGLIKASLAAGQLSQRQARNLADLESNVEIKVKKLAALLSAPKLSSEERCILLADILTAARTIKSEWSRAGALASLLPHLESEQRLAMFAEVSATMHAGSNRRVSVINFWSKVPDLPPELLPAVLVEILAALNVISDREYHYGRFWPTELLAEAVLAARTLDNQFDCAAVLGFLAPHLTPGLLAKVLAIARALPHYSSQIDILASLAPHLPPELLAEALSFARAIGAETYRSKALGSLVPHLPPEQRANVLAEALEAARVIHDEKWRTDALGLLLPYFPPEQRADVLAETFAAAHVISNKGQRTEALEFLAPHMSSKMLADAVLTVRAIGDESARSHALLILAPYLPPEQRSSVLEDVLTLARTVADEFAHAHDLRSIALHLSPEQRPAVLSEALVAARTLSNDEHRASALGSLAPHLQLEERLSVLAEALVAVMAIGDEHSRNSSLSSLVPHLPPELLIEVCAIARTTGDGWQRAKALGSLAPLLPPKQRSPCFAEAIAAARTLSDVGLRANALKELAPHLPQKQRALVSAEAITVARGIHDDWKRATFLGSMAPYLPPKQRLSVFAEALATARAIDDVRRRASALETLAPYLPVKQRPLVFAEALATARAIDDANKRAALLKSLAQHLPQEQRPTVLAEALAAACSVCDERGRLDALVSLASHLPSEQRPDIFSMGLAAASAISDEKGRSAALAILAPHLPPELLIKALAVARTISNEESRVSAFLSLAPHLRPELRSTLFGCIIQNYTNLPRGHTMALLAFLAPLLSEVGDKLIEKTTQTIRDVGRWWP